MGGDLAAPERATGFDGIDVEVLHRQHRLFKGVADANVQLLSRRDEEGFATALATLGVAAHVDRTYLFELVEDPEGRLRVNQRLAWARRRGHTRRNPPEFQEVDLDAAGLRDWYEKLCRGEVIVGARESLAPAVQPTLKRFAIRSILLVPVRAGARLWGALGFDDCSAPRSWTEEEQVVLRNLAGSIGTMLDQRHSEDRYRSLVRSLDAAVWEGRLTDDGLQFSLVLGRPEEILDEPVEEWTAHGRFWSERLHPEDRDRVREAYRAAATSIGTRSIEYRLRTRDGRYVWILDQVQAVDPAGREPRLRGMMVDVSERRRQEQEKARLAAIIEATSDFVGMVDLERAESYVNRAGRAMLGLADDAGRYRRTDVLTDHTPEWAREILFKEAVPVAMREGIWTGESALVDAAGREVPVSQVVLAHRSPGGKVEFFSTIARDISQSKRFEGQIRAQLEVVKEVGSTLDLEEIFDHVQRRVVELLPCERTSIGHWDEERGTFRMVAQYRIPEELLSDAVAMEFQPREDLRQRMRAGHSAIIDDVERQGWIPADVLRRFGVTAMALVPLVVRDRLLGTLAAIRTTPGATFDTGDIEMLDGIAHHLTVAVEAAQLYRAQREEAEVAGALARVGRELIAAASDPSLLTRLCRIASEVVGAPLGATYLFDAGRGRYAPVARFESAGGERPIDLPALRVSAVQRLVVRLGREDLVATDGDTGMPAGLCLALRSADTLVGFQWVGCRENAPTFSPLQRRIAEGVAQIASLALENRRLLEALEGANRLKSDFVATISHELRTPLNVIIGYNDLLRDEMFGAVNEAQRDTLQRMNRSAWGLLDLINATLDVSRIDSGQLPVERRRIEIAQLMTEIDLETREMRAKPGIRCEFHVAAGLPLLETDPVKLKVVVKNLISNAVKFTDEGTVSVTVAANAGGIEVAVRDTGVGIAPDQSDAIFDAFRQADGSITRRHGGVGLGLYIVRRLLDLLEGRIDLESRPGEGSTFRVWLPAASRD